MNSNQIIFSTIPIQARNANEEGKATSFIVKYANCYYLVTNRHVVENRPYITLNIKAKDKSNALINITTTFTINAIKYFDEEYDLCAIPCKPIINDFINSNIVINNTIIELDNYIQTLPEINDIEKVVIIGYPNYFMDKVNNLPICLSGITATSINYDYNGFKHFLIDGSGYHGSSGSPVFIHKNDEYYLVGICDSSLPYISEINHVDNNSEETISSYKIESASCISRIIKIEVLVKLIQRINNNR